jgi:carbon storage regulator
MADNGVPAGREKSSWATARTGQEDDPMLVLSRKQGEGVTIGGDIEVTVLEVRGERVKLGFRSPDDVSIRREEIYWKMRRQEAVDCADVV